MRYLFLLLAPLAFGQSLSLQCPATVKAGAVLTYSVVLSGGAQPSDLQWTLTTTQNIGATTPTAAGSGLAAQKTAIQNANGTVILAGVNTNAVNANPISDGVVATITATIPLALANVTVNLGLAGALGAKPPGTPLPIPPPNGCAVSVLPNTSFCDVNGDGVVDASDATAERAGVLAIPQSVARFDRDGNGTADVVDVEIVINAALGKPCTATQ